MVPSDSVINGIVLSRPTWHVTSGVVKNNCRLWCSGAVLCFFRAGVFWGGFKVVRYCAVLSGIGVADLWSGLLSVFCSGIRVFSLKILVDAFGRSGKCLSALARTCLEKTPRSTQRTL